MKNIPLHSLVIVVGPSRPSKTAFVNQKFESYEVISLEGVKASLVGDETRQDINRDAFFEIYHRVRLKLRLGERIVVNSPNLKYRDRESLARIGEQADVPIFYIIHNETSNQDTDLLKYHQELFVKYESDILRGDGLAEVIDARTEDFEVVSKLPKGDMLSEIKLRKFKGITAIGDVHGMRQALKSAINWSTARNHFMVFLGDIVDYGPKSLECLEDVYDIVMSGNGTLIYGNHERKIERWIDQDRKGKITIRISEANKVTIDAIKKLTQYQRKQFEIKYKGLMKSARHHVIIGNMLFTHGAAHPDMFDIDDYRLQNKKLSSLAMFAQIDPVNKMREDGYPNRIYDWVDDIPKGKIVVVGHDIRSTGAPIAQPGKKGGDAIFLDTGSGKSGTLTSADIRFKNNEPLAILNYNRH